SLNPNTNYYFQVRSSSAVFVSAYSGALMKSTLAEIPIGLNIQSRTNNSITVVWNPNGNGPNTFYNAVLLDGLDNEIASSTLTSLTASLSSLSPNTT
ncbi:MAG TPA: hypothetical protein PLN68_09235, partial [Elusimicrobiales bacterium]|nr:hypothetical protein [Elusimicrobiales bacterium]